MRSSGDRLALLLRLVAIASGAANAGAAMMAQAMGEDGINYLDQGDAWFRGDWSTAINGTWSPLYPILLGLTMRVVQPSIQLEFPVVHALNFAVYVATLFSFEYFWKQVTERYYARSEGSDLLPPWAFTSLGYALFIWTSVCLIRLFAVTPDMLVALTVFLAAGLILRLTSAQATIRVALLLGAVLGLGFLAKTVMFPVGILTIVLCVVALRRSGRRGYALPVVAGFAIVAGPFLVALSRDVGQVTFGEVGRVSYLKHVLLAPYPHYRHDGVDIAGAPVHPMEFAATTPPVVRFDAGIPVTYPPAYDQGYWYAGLAPTFRPALQWRTVAVNLQRYFDLFVRLQGIGLAVLVVVLIVRGRRSIAVESLVLATIALAAMGLYLLVYVEGRYLAPFIVMLWAAALSTVQLPASPKNPPWLRASSFVMVGSFVLNIGVFHLDGLNALLGFAPVAVAGPVSRTETGPDKATDIAVALREQGVAEGDRVGVIGEAIHATWARLARVRIVAEVHPLDAPTFWRGSAEARSGVLAAFDQARVRAVIAETPPAGAPVEEWTRLGNTSYYVRITGRADSISFRAPTR